MTERSRAPDDGAPLLQVHDLKVQFAADDGLVRAVDGVSLQLKRGRTLAIVGESGSGKTACSLTVLGLTRRQGARVSGRIAFEGRDLLALSEDQLRRIRGGEIAMVFQDPRAALHPLLTVGGQLVEAVRAHRHVARARLRTRAVELLELVGIGAASTRINAYPHELSGGMCQRVMIAMALANEPKLLIADEPTSSLDVTVQARILALLRRLRDELSMALVLVTHDLGVAGEMADEIAVMYAGRFVEVAPTERLLSAPEHPYTWGLLQSMPTLHGPRERQLRAIPGSPPSPVARPSGCSFHPRCPYARPAHAQTDPSLQPVPGAERHRVACLLAPPERQALWAQLRGRPASAQATAQDRPGASL